MIDAPLAEGPDGIPLPPALFGIDSKDENSRRCRGRTACRCACVSLAMMVRMLYEQRKNAEANRSGIRNISGIAIRAETLRKHVSDMRHTDRGERSARRAREDTAQVLATYPHRGGALYASC